MEFGYAAECGYEGGDGVGGHEEEAEVREAVMGLCWFRRLHNGRVGYTLNRLSGSWEAQSIGGAALKDGIVWRVFIFSRIGQSKVKSSQPRMYILAITMSGHIYHIQFRELRSAVDLNHTKAAYYSEASKPVHT